MDIRLRATILTLALIGALLAGCPRAAAGEFAAGGKSTPADTTATYYFYHGREYGSERLAHPLRLIVNSGFGILQLDSRSNRLSDVHWENGWRNVWHNLGNPIEAIEELGWRTFISSEILPLSINKNDSQYWPNYLNHLIGGGMSYRLMREYFAWHGYPHPTLWAVSTIYASHFLNETVEMNDRTGWSVDPVADIYIFDLGGIILFSSDRVSRFFSRTLNMTEWSSMPFYDPQTGALESVGQNYMVRLALGHTTPWSIFYHWCNGGELGVSRRLGGGHNLSIAGGLKAKRLINVDQQRESVDLVRTGGLFYDRDGSLMASLMYTMNKDARWQLNVYPGLAQLGPLQPGFTVIVTQDFDVLAGVTLGSLPVVPVGLGGRVGS
jgi:hypothetical protein